jgi:hypothetical protein
MNEARHTEFATGVPGLIPVCTTLPIRLWSPNGSHRDWHTVQKRANDQRRTVALALTPRLIFFRQRLFWDHVAQGPVVEVFVTRLFPSGPGLDPHDNLPMSAKHVVDGIADALGVQDNDPRVVWRYQQRKYKGWGVEIDIVHQLAGRRS